MIRDEEISHTEGSLLKYYHKGAAYVVIHGRLIFIRAKRIRATFVFVSFSFVSPDMKREEKVPF